MWRYLTPALCLLAGVTAWRQRPVEFLLFNAEGERKYLPATVPGGLAIFDYDGDGRLDVFFTNGGELPSGRKTSAQHSNRLLRNLGDMRFADATATAGLAGSEYSFGAAAGDYDNDGRTDLLVCNLRSVTLYRNLGHGKFEDVTARARLDNQSRWSVAAAWSDIDNDGDLDLFVVNYVAWDPAKEPPCTVNGKPDFCHPKYYDPVPNPLFRNNGDGTFTDISTFSGIAAHKGKGMSVAAADFDSDGLQDFYVTNDRVFAFAFRNLGSNRFQEVAFDWGVAVPEDGRPVSGMGVDAQDYDNDGKPDLLFSALKDETFPLFRNTGQGFIETTIPSGLSLLTRSFPGWGVQFADLDNDGWKDVVVASSDALSPTGGRGNEVKGPVFWLRNSGSGRFDRTAPLPAPLEMYRGLVAADLDDDGCLDLIVSALNAPGRILKNPCSPDQNWIKVDVRSPNARVRVNNQWRHNSSAVSYASSYVGPLHFGLGQNKTAHIEVFFSGRTVRRLQVPANQTVRVDR